MATRKERIGFETPAAKMDEMMAKLRAALQDPKVNWAIFDLIFSSFVDAMEQKPGKRTDSEGIVTGIAMTNSLIARLGKELVATNELLSAIEKKSFAIVRLQQ